MWTTKQTFIGPFLVLSLVIALPGGKAPAKEEDSIGIGVYLPFTDLDIGIETGNEYSPDKETFQQEVASQKEARQCLPDCDATKTPFTKWRIGPYQKRTESSPIDSAGEASEQAGEH